MEHNKLCLLCTDRTYTREDFVFFWGHTSKSSNVGKHCLSQWYMCSFMVDDVCYNCAEQYMMAEKARLFGDDEVWHQIMESCDPMAIKKFGRTVKNFNVDVWERNCREIVKKGNFAKFSQSNQLMEYLLGTGNKILVEASPKDTICGIGLSEDSPKACNPHLWRGENLLGFALMDVRDMLNIIA